MHYRQEIDGLRAIAVLPVILFHAGFQAFSGGFVGVDVFFVISGYLITGILLAEREAGTYSILAFYERRARRILPALFLVLAATLPFAWLWLTPLDLLDFAQSLAAVPLFVSNILFWHQSGYFDTAAELKPLLHTWSLAVEEQYYLLFPLLLGLGGALGRKGLLVLLAALGAASLAAAHWGAQHAPSASFFLFPTRFWEILVGSFVAFAFAAGKQPAPSRSVSEAGSLLGLTLIAVAVFAFDRETPFPGLYALVPTLGTALVLLFATPATVAGRLLGTKALVGVGLVSFSAYLWHQPLLVFARHRLEDPAPLLLLGLCAAALGLAYFSWRFVEQPFRARGRISRQAVARFAGIGAIAFVAAGLAGNAKKGFEGRFSAFAANTERNQMATIANGWCFYSVDTMAQLPVGEAGLRCALGSKGASTRALLFGDSFAAQYEPLLDAVGKAADLRVDAVTTNWCHPASADDFGGPRASRAFAQCAINRRYLMDQAGRYDVLVFGGDWGSLQRQGRLQSVQDVVRLLAPKVPLLVLLPSPTIFDGNINLQAQLLEENGRHLRIAHVSRRKDAPAAAANEALARLAGELPNVLFVARDALFRANGRPSELTSEDKPFSFDGAHISVYGARKAAEEYLRSVQYSELRDRLARSRKVPAPRPRPAQP